MADQHDKIGDRDDQAQQTAVIPKVSESPKVQWPTVEPDQTAVLPPVRSNQQPVSQPRPQAQPQPQSQPQGQPQAEQQFSQSEQPTDVHQVPQRPVPPLPTEEESGRRWSMPELPWKRIGLVAAIAFGALVVVYLADLGLTRGELPRGVSVAGVSVGGMDRAAAEQKLHQQIEPRLTQPVPVHAGDVDATIDPAKAGLRLDWGATLDSAGSQPLNPWTRLTSFFGTREVGVVTQVERVALAAEVEALRATTDREPAEGTIRFEGTTPVAVDPKPGQTIDAEPAIDALTAQWVLGSAVELPVTTKPVITTSAGVNAALESIAKPATSGPVTVNGEGAKATLTPEVTATALTFEPGTDGGLNPKLDNAKVIEALQPQLAETEQPGKDATVVLEGGRPVVKASVDGRGVDWEKSLGGLLDVLKSTDARTIDATYTHQPAKFTTEQANQMGITEVVSEFTTRGFASDSGVNIRAIANEVNGALIKPGETFSLNGHTGPRGVPQGYIEAGIIESGRPARAVGGGCSQFATTLFNAAYFAGMTDVEHREHSYFISRYPEAREATVFQSPGGASIIDVKFRNDSPSGVMIQTIWTPSDVTVRFWSTTHYKVDSITGGRSEFTEPNTVTIPAGEPCSATNGAQGFRVSNTRVVSDIRTGRELKRNSRTAVYNPLPKVICEPPPPGMPPPSG